MNWRYDYTFENKPSNLTIPLKNGNECGGFPGFPESEKTWPILDTAGCSQQKKLIFSAASYFVNRSPEIKGTDSEQRGRSIELHHMILRVTHDLEKGSGFSKLGAGCTAKSLEDC